MKKNNKQITIFEGQKIRRIYNEKQEKWYFSVVDIIRVLIQQANYQTTRKYWNKLKGRLKKEGNESVSNCHQLDSHFSKNGKRLKRKLKKKT